MPGVPGSATAADGVGPSGPLDAGSVDSRGSR